MNGNGFIQEVPAGGGGGIVTDFFGAAQAKIGEITSRFSNLPTSPEQSIGGSIFEAIYQLGKGRADLARERAATALLASKTGQRFVGEVEAQRIKQWLPLIIGGIIVLLVAGFAFGRR